MGTRWELMGTEGTDNKDKTMIIDGIEMVEVQPDDRHFCEECTNFKQYDWKGLCNAQKVKMPNILNRCDTFEAKHKPVVKKQNFITEDFWK